MRDFIGGDLCIDGRQIPFRVFTYACYFEAKGYSEKQIEKITEEKGEMITVLNQVIALKQSCFLLRCVRYSCGTLSDDLYALKNRLINELKEKYNFDFDEDMVDNTCPGYED